MAGKESFGELLVNSLNEAVAHDRGELKARTERISLDARKAQVAPPPRYTADNIRKIRRGLGVSQPIFAGMLNVSGSTVRAWEQGVREPGGPTLRLLEIAEKNPSVLVDAVADSLPGRSRHNRTPLEK